MVIGASLLCGLVLIVLALERRPAPGHELVPPGRVNNPPAAAVS